MYMFDEAGLSKKMYTESWVAPLMGGCAVICATGTLIFTSLSLYVIVGELVYNVSLEPIQELENIKMIVSLFVFFMYGLHNIYKVDEEDSIDMTKDSFVIVALIWGVAFNNIAAPLLMGILHFTFLKKINRINFRKKKKELVDLLKRNITSKFFLKAN